MDGGNWYWETELTKETRVGVVSEGGKGLRRSKGEIRPIFLTFPFPLSNILIRLLCFFLIWSRILSLLEFCNRTLSKSRCRGPVQDIIVLYSTIRTWLFTTH